MVITSEDLKMILLIIAIKISFKKPVNTNVWSETQKWIVTDIIPRLILKFYISDLHIPFIAPNYVGCMGNI